MAKRSRPNLIEESIITLHFAAPTTPEEAEVLNALKEAGSKKYLKTVERTRMLAEWYKAHNTKMKLFVANTDSPNPEDWSSWDEISLLLAESVEQAEILTDKRSIIEVNMNKPALLCSLSEPSWGDDL